MSVVVITGTSSGIGLAVAINLAAVPNTTLITLNRTQESADSSAKVLLSHVPNLQLDSRVVDLMHTSDVIDEAKRIRDRYDKKINTVILNSGVMFVPYCLNSDGIESHYAINFTSHSLLVDVLMPSLRSGGRVIATSSVAYKWASCSEEALIYATSKPSETHYGTGLRAYAESKLALIIWARHCAAKYETVNFMTVHPGVCNTNLFSHSVWPSIINACAAVGLIKSPAQGADAILHVTQADIIKR